MAVIRKAILTGGGLATRLRPVTATLNKHLIPLANKPMIQHAIEKVCEVGVREIFINTNPGDTQLEKALGNGDRFGVSITYFEQTGGPQGIAHVVKCAEKFVGDEPFMFYLSDNIILGSLQPFFNEFEQNDLDCMLALSEVADPRHLGVAKFNERGVLTEIVEKPERPPSNLAVTGIYLYNKNFFTAFDHIQKSPRGEYEISDIHTYFLKQGYKVGYKEITGWWKDTGKPDDLIIANRLLLDELPDSAFGDERVAVDPTAIVDSSSVLVGPVIIGPGAHIIGANVGPYVTVGAGSRIEGGSVQNSIILEKCVLSRAGDIEGSIIGNNAVIRQASAARRLILGENTLAEI